MSNTNSFGLGGRVVVITGASNGIGAACARRLARDGARVALWDVAEGPGSALAAELRAAGQDACFIACDVSSKAAVDQATATTVSEFGRIDGLVNNAGGQYRAGLETISTKGFEAVVKNNLTGGFIFMREVFNRWMKDHGGSIVNIIADISNGWPMFGHSAAARGGMLTLSESAACEWAQYGVRVNALAPGGIASSGFEVYTPENWAEVRKVAAKVPMQRFGNEAEVSAGIVFLLSPAASYITGTCLRIDGGSPNARATFELKPHDRSPPPFDGFHRARPTRT
jgi:citronellol/citronellal dehydrogenase